MNQERTKELLPIMQAFSEGEVIEFSSKEEINPEWAEVFNALWVDSCNYRIKPAFSKGDVVLVRDSLTDKERVRVFKEYARNGMYITYTYASCEGVKWCKCRKFEP